MQGRAGGGAEPPGVEAAEVAERAAAGARKGATAARGGGHQRAAAVDGGPPRGRAAARGVPRDGVPSVPRGRQGHRGRLRGQRLPFLRGVRRPRGRRSGAPLRPEAAPQPAGPHGERGVPRVRGGERGRAVEVSAGTGLPPDRRGAATGLLHGHHRRGGPAALGQDRGSQHRRLARRAFAQRPCPGAQRRPQSGPGGRARQGGGRRGARGELERGARHGRAFHVPRRGGPFLATICHPGPRDHCDREACRGRAPHPGQRRPLGHAVQPGGVHDREADPCEGRRGGPPLSERCRAVCRHAAGEGGPQPGQCRQHLCDCGGPSPAAGHLDPTRGVPEPHS
mmetsp:Transcript_29666/g.82885  ORF Transcript_29666/g.82885 Transcript_29666/m.82885 type:complete len:338 (+) Transcript_29666:303-1316(+)